jgi:hypothetical protein
LFLNSVYQKGSGSAAAGTQAVSHLGPGDVIIEMAGEAVRSGDAVKQRRKSLLLLVRDRFGTARSAALKLME